MKQYEIGPGLLLALALGGVTAAQAEDPLLPQYSTEGYRSPAPPPGGGYPGPAGIGAYQQPDYVGLGDGHPGPTPGAGYLPSRDGGEGYGGPDDGGLGDGDASASFEVPDAYYAPGAERDRPPLPPAAGVPGYPPQRDQGPAQGLVTPQVAASPQGLGPSGGNGPDDREAPAGPPAGDGDGGDRGLNPFQAMPDPENRFRGDQR